MQARDQAAIVLEVVVAAWVFVSLATMAYRYPRYKARSRIIMRANNNKYNR